MKPKGHILQRLCFRAVCKRLGAMGAVAHATPTPPPSRVRDGNESRDVEDNAVRQRTSRPAHRRCETDLSQLARFYRRREAQRTFVFFAQSQNTRTNLPMNIISLYDIHYSLLICYININI